MKKFYKFKNNPCVLSGIDFLNVKRKKGFSFYCPKGREKNGFIFVKRGKLSYVFKNEEIGELEITSGDVLFIPPNVAHSYSIKRDVSMLILGFDTSYSEISRMRNLSSTIPPETLPQYRKIYLQSNIYEDYDLPYIFKPENAEEYISCWKEIKDAVQKNNSYATEIRMTKLLNRIHERLGITKIKTKVDICEIVKDFIDAGYEKIITLDEIASLYEVNKFTISKKFKDRYGISIIAYYNEKRLSYAKRELSNPSVTVSFVSETLNFTDVYTFSKFFKMHTGMSPRAFKTRSAADEG